MENIIKGPKVSKEILENMKLTLHDYFFKICRNRLDKILMTDAETGESITCGQILEESRRIANFLRSRGCKEGTVVAIASENRFEYPSIFLAIIQTGAICTCINPMYSSGEFLHAFHISKPRFAFVTRTSFDGVNKLREKCNFLDEIFNLDEKNVYCADKYRNHEYDENTCAVNSDDLATIFYSSGTTGLSKGVMLMHKSYVFLMEAYRTGELVQFPENNVVSGLLPLSHAYGMFIMLSCLALGHRYILIKRYSESSFLCFIEKYRINTLHIVPPIIVFLSKDAKVFDYDLSSVKFISSGGAPLRKEVELNVKSRLPSCVFLQHYGMTETTTMCLISSPMSKTGMTGKLLPGMMAKVINLENGAILGPHQPGEICVKGPLLMKGYCGLQNVVNNGTDSEGWLHTGDIAYYDEDYDFCIVDRVKELIKYKGFQVPPAELELLLLQHQAVDAVGVVGVPDEEAGELPRAYVVIKSGFNITEKEIEKYVADNLSPPKKLRGGVKFVTEIPQTPTGKVDRKILKKWAHGG